MKKYDIRDHFSKYVTPMSTMNMVQYIRKFVNEPIIYNMYVAQNGIVHRVTFGKSKMNDVLSIFKFDVSSYNMLKKKNETLQLGSTTADPVNLLLLTTFSETNQRIFIDFLALKIFLYRYNRSFPYGMDENVMKETLSKLSGRYLIKKYGSVQGALIATVNRYLNNYVDEIKFDNLKDENYLELIQALSTRIGIMVKNIATVYYNTQNKMFSQKDNKDEDNYILTTNESVKIQNVINKTVNDLKQNKFDNNVINMLPKEQSRKFKEDMKNNNFRNNISNISKMMINDCMKDKKIKDVNSFKRNILKYADSGKGSWASELSKTLTIVNSDKNKEYDKFIRKYISYSIFRQL